METYHDDKTLKKPKNHIGYRIAMSLILTIASVFILLFNLSSPQAQTTTFLNQDEIQWLNKIQSPIKIGITSIPGQIIMTKNDTYQGFSIDLFKKIVKVTGINFEYVYFETWNDVINAGINRNIDIIFLAQKTKSRLIHFDFTDAVLSQQNKIITKIGQPINMIEEFLKLKIAISKGSAVFEYLQYNFNNINLIPTQNVEESLLHVSRGFADIAISESVRASYYLKKLDIKNVHIADDLNYDYHLRIASRKDLPILNVILTKAIDTIPSKEIQALHLKWGFVKDKHNYFDTQTLIYLSIAFGVIIPFILYVTFLNKQLRGEIIDRKNALQKLQIAHDEVHHLKFLAEQDARTDDLTHVLNNRGFREVLHQHIKEYKTDHHVFCFIFLDIDFFKKINDKMGHDTGDKVLTDFAKMIRKTLKTDDYIGRVGGEEFAFIFPNTNLMKAVEITEHLRKIINHHTFNINQFTFQISASFGVAEITKQDTITSLYKRTDELLYQSKSNGRNKVSY